jgi:hypothetical protein
VAFASFPAISDDTWINAYVTIIVYKHTQ